MTDGATLLAAAKTGRNSIGIDIDPAYCRMAERRLERETRSLFGQATVTLEEPGAHARPASRGCAALGRFRRAEAQTEGQEGNDGAAKPGGASPRPQNLRLPVRKENNSNEQEDREFTW